MKHWKQENSECALVSACMAYDQNYPRASRAFEFRAGRTWKEALSRSPGWMHCVEFLREITGVEPLWFRASDRWQGYGKIVRPPLGGTGILTIDSGPSKSRHAVAWADGQIYDGNAPYAMPWDMWVEHYPGAWLDGWHPRKLPTVAK